MLDFAKWLVITHIGRLCLSCVLLFSGGVLSAFFNFQVVFYTGIVLFFGQCLIMFYYMFVGFIYDNWNDNDWL